MSEQGVWYILTRENPDTGTQEWVDDRGSWRETRRFAQTFDGQVVQGMRELYRGSRIVKVANKPAAPKTHDLKWALRMLGRGKRVRRVAWVNPCYLEIASSGIVDEDGRDALSFLAFSDGWTLYREPSQ